jgi:hypothetical protein
VLQAEEIGGPDFMRWTARHAAEFYGTGRIRVQPACQQLGDVGDWVRVSMVSEVPRHVRRLLRSAQQEPGEQFITRHFVPSMSFNTVMTLSGEWHDAVATGLEASHRQQFPLPWYDGGCIDGFEITPITTNADLYREGKAMHHCVGTYVPEVMAGCRYVYSVMFGGVRRATLELVHCDGGSKAGVRLGQVRGPCNTTPPADVMRATRQWFILNQRSHGLGRQPMAQPAKEEWESAGVADGEFPF